MEESSQAKAVPETIQTGLGDVEFLQTGQGPPVLFVHGSPGGSDSSLVMGRFLVQAGFSLIAPSRPGYLGTPLRGRAEIDQQADLLAALLDALEIEMAGVIAWSGGGPSGYRLAVRHPGKVSSLVTFASVSQEYEPPKAGIDERLMDDTTFGNWILRFMANHMEKSTIKATLAAEGDLDREQLKELVEGAIADEAQSDVVLTMANVVGDHQHRAAGLENDMARFGEIKSLELERIPAPTLVIHGDADTDVTDDHGKFASEQINGAELILMDAGTHLSLFVHPECEAVQTKVVDHLKGAQ